MKAAPLAALVLLGLVLAPASRAAAESDAIVTDRPDVCESSQTVGRWRFQAELGLDAETRERAGATRTDLGTALKLRFGLSEATELHLETAGLAMRRLATTGGDPPSATVGLADVDLGGKVHLLDQRGPVPSTALLAAVTLPIGAKALSDDRAWLLVPTLLVDWTWLAAWGTAINLGPTVALSRRGQAADRLRYALSISRSWAPLLTALGSYFECFGETDLAQGDTSLALDGGFTWQPRSDLQLDLTLRGRLIGDMPDLGGALGVSFKL
ncbi:MAG: transporter [Proteobacteria bacterium]|nr:transporter [Pseudomonadota bacterium]